MKKQILIGVLVLLAAALVVLANPILTAIPAQTVEEGQSMSFSVITTTPDNGDTVFSLATGAPSWASIAKVDNTHATVTLNPDLDVVSSKSDISEDFSITVVAQDGDLVEDTQTFTATVTQLPLKVYNLEVRVDDDRVSGIDEDEIDTIMDIDDVYLGSEIKIEIELKNLFDEVEDIKIDAVLYDIDDGDDLEEEDDINKIKAGERSDPIELVFEVPETANDETYELEITITGDNEDTNEEYEIVLKFDVNVEKKSHDLRIDKAELTPSTVSCDRTSDFYLRIKNLGDSEEDEVRVTVENSALGLSFSESDIEMDDDVDEEWTKTITIDAEGIAPGEYKIKTKVYYNDDNLEDIQDVILTVQSCAQEEEEEESEPEPVVIVTPDAEEDATSDDSNVIETYEDGFFDNGMTNILLIAGIIIVLILNIVLLVVAFRR